MKIINIKNYASKIDRICECCGELISKGSEYTYIRYRNDNRRLAAFKVHNKCHFVATELSFPYNNPYWFIKEVTKWVKIAIKDNKHTVSPQQYKETLNRVNKGTKKLIIDMAHFAISNSEKRATTALPEEITKEFIIASSMMTMMPNIMDDVISELRKANIYRHTLKLKVSKVLKDFEIMCRDSYNHFLSCSDGADSADRMVNDGMRIYDQIQDAVLLDGIDRACNILMACLDILKDKYTKIDAHLPAKTMTTYCELIKSRLSEILIYNHHSAIYLLVKGCCGTEDIEIIK